MRLKAAVGRQRSACHLCGTLTLTCCRGCGHRVCLRCAQTRAPCQKIDDLRHAAHDDDAEAHRNPEDKLGHVASRNAESRECRDGLRDDLSAADVCDLTRFRGSQPDVEGRDSNVRGGSVGNLSDGVNANARHLFGVPIQSDSGDPRERHLSHFGQVQRGGAARAALLSRLSALNPRPRQAAPGPRGRSSSPAVLKPTIDGDVDGRAASESCTDPSSCRRAARTAQPVPAHRHGHGTSFNPTTCNDAAAAAAVAVAAASASTSFARASRSALLPAAAAADAYLDDDDTELEVRPNPREQSVVRPTSPVPGALGPTTFGRNDDNRNQLSRQTQCTSPPVAQGRD